jgi:radical SAM superfamily enzyme YgiQ (UPF0313 family)
MADMHSLDSGLYTQADSASDARYMGQMREQAKNPSPTDKNKPRITLVLGPSPFSMMRGWEFFITSPQEGLGVIATVLHNAGYPVRIVDVRYAVDPLNEAFRQVMEGSDTVGIVTGEDGYPFVEELTALIKEKDPKLPVFLGGSLVSSVPHVLMANTRADLAVISEGEITVLELMDAFADGRWPEERLAKINGLWYRTASGELRHTPPRGQMKDLDSVPAMNLSLWPQAKGPLGLQPQIISSHSRGCKMDCTFCYRTTPQLREKSVQKVRAELKLYTEVYKTNFIMFADLTFTSNKRRTLELCEMIKEFRIHWGCMTRCTDVDPEVLGAMRAAGCDIILFGVESLSPEVQKKARKGYTENLILRTVKNTQEAGIVFGGLTIVGLPGETEESLDHLCEWAEETQSITRVKYLSAMPGTNVYADGLKRGIIRSELEHLRWLSTEQAMVHDEFLNYNGLPEQVMRRAYQRISDSYCKGPVMDFKHWPENFAKFYPDPRKEWRKEFAYAGAPLAPGAERFLLPHLTSQTVAPEVRRPRTGTAASSCGRGSV